MVLDAGETNMSGDARRNQSNYKTLDTKSTCQDRFHMWYPLTSGIVLHVPCFGSRLRGHCALDKQFSYTWGLNENARENILPE